MAALKPGGRMKSTVCNAEVIVVKAPADEVALTCGGAPMVDPAEAGEATGAPVDGAAEGCQLGKRYVNDDESLEVLVTKAGDGSLGADGATLALKESKPLPASD